MYSETIAIKFRVFILILAKLVCVESSEMLTTHSTCAASAEQKPPQKWRHHWTARTGVITTPGYFQVVVKRSSDPCGSELWDVEGGPTSEWDM